MTSRLLEVGLFPSELPPAFSTTDFANYAATRSGSLGRSKQEIGEVSSLLKTRPGRLSRQLHVVNPVSALECNELLEANWPTLQAHFGIADLALSRPQARRSGRRAITPTVPFGEVQAKRARMMHFGRFHVRVDVRACYSSIYTHAIEWALYGKALVKAQLAGGNHAKSSLGAKLDRAMMRMQHGETKGIPVGPDSSFVTAEIVLTAVDRVVEGSLGSRAKQCFRYVDEYEYFTNSQDDAEKFVSTVQRALAEYGLEVNQSKVSISPSFSCQSGIWLAAVRNLARSLRTTTPKVLTNDVVAYFDSVAHHAAEAPGDPVLQFAVRSAAAKVQGQQPSAVWVDMVLAGMRQYPSSIQAGCESIQTLASRGWRPRKGLDRSLNMLAVDFSEGGYGVEVSWILDTMLQLGLRLSAQAIKSIDAMADNAPLLYLLEFERQGLVDSRATVGRFTKVRASAATM